MSKPYHHLTIEKKWQKFWDKEKLWETKQRPRATKQYVLDMFPYPSAEGLHVGHPEGYTASDIIARYFRMRGDAVLHPMGWDAFGLPAENYAIKTGTHPKEITAKNIKNFKRQIQSLGFSYDWSHEINTSDPDYYRWTQWIFLQLFKKGLAYEAVVPINWCPKDKTGLANEEVVGGKCDRCGTPVVKKDVRQWMLRITKYADRLLRGLDNLDWPEPIKLLQRNWIGRSEGVVVSFSVIASGREAILSRKGIKTEIAASFRQAGTSRNDTFRGIKVFTTRADTLFGATYLVVAPEHPLVQSSLDIVKNRLAVEKYIEQAKSKSDLERTSLEKDKTGVELKGLSAINPATGKKIPIWVSDYVLISYGTGAIMAVPGHDERDYAFAKKYKLPIIRVIEPKFVAVEGESAVKPDQPFVNRNAICAIVRNPKNDTYLCVEWKTVHMHGLVTGGVEDDEDIIKAAQREIHEETGYKNLRFVRNLDFAIHSLFYHRVKKENRWARFQYLWFELEDEKRDPVDAKEASLHKIVWKRVSELKNFFSVVEGEFILNFIKNPDYVHTGEGILVNSGKYDGLSSGEGGQKIVEWLEKNNIGEKAVNYKLRDWVFSRQRYWGEPIPLIHCPRCKERVISTPHHLNFYNQEMWNLLVSGVKVVESRALNPEEQERFLGRIKKGDIIRCVNKVTSTEVFVQVTASWTFKNIEALYRRPEITKDLRGKEFDSLSELREFYAALSPDYEKRVEKNGLIVWRVQLVVPGIIPVSEEDLPVKLPDVKKYEPTGTGESPLAGIENWVKVKCPQCHGEAQRETNTMPQWAGSCWYYLRYLDPDNKNELVGKEKEKYWMGKHGVDVYIGGAEHAVLHLMYARFWHMALYDIGAVSTPEPFCKLKNQGMILGEDGQKMSKSRGNVINPDKVIEEFGADSMRMYEMFMGPFEAVKPWSTQGIRGVYRFLQRVWSMQDKIKEISVPEPLERLRHRLIKKITSDIETYNFNTAVSTFMETINTVAKEDTVPKIFWKTFLILLSPFAPHISEELWELMGHEKSIVFEKWPSHKEELLLENEVEFIVQVNGKLRDRIKAPIDSTEEIVQQLSLASAKVRKYVRSVPQNTIFVKNKLINFVV